MASAGVAEFAATGTFNELERRVLRAMRVAFGEDVVGAAMLTAATKPEFGDYQCNAAMGLAKTLKLKPRDVATKIVEALDVAPICEAPSIAGPGFINLTLAPAFVNSRVVAALGDQDKRLGISRVAKPQKIVVDFSSPNIAKEMHVGHLRSTIIGDSLSRLLEFKGHDVLRLNHVGDWGTQFGMLIVYLREVAPHALDADVGIDLGDLVEFYKKAKARFDEDEAFQDAARREVVALQSGAEETVRGWQLLCAQSRAAFDEVYSALDVRLTERGESFYNPYLSSVITGLQEKGLAVEDGGAQCVFLEGYKNREGKPQPLIVQKSDGGFMYATTDLAAIRYRLGEDHATRVLYVTDVGQAVHFEQVFQVARRAGWLPTDGSVSLEHVPFGLVQGEDGKKFKTRSGDTVRLMDLLEEAVRIARADFEARLTEDGREETSEYIEGVARTVGIGAVKYADLKNNRVSNYRFSYAKMLALTGNTAPYMLYAYARIQGIYRKGDVDVVADAAAGRLTLCLEAPEELILAKTALRLCEVLDDLERELKPNVLCEFMFDLAQRFNQFYENCPVLGAEDSTTRASRLALCELCAQTLKLSFNLLGIKTLERL
uniref:arginine--tRNA ligase n=1 Tax=Erythrolobus australicus TaxID=1077150 RepID=A0A7S1TKW6_9RHOD